MKKISVKNIIEFRRRSPKSQISFINQLKRPKEKGDSDQGGHYWIHSISPLTKYFMSEKKELLKDKISILIEKQEEADAKISKVMFSRNISILKNFQGFNISSVKPKNKLVYLPRPAEKSIISVKGLSVQVLPSHVFAFGQNKTQYVSAVWFVAKLDGYKTEELAIYTEALHRYLKLNYSKEYEIDPDYCIAIDMMNLNSLSYSQIIKKEIPRVLSSTADSICKILEKV